MARTILLYPNPKLRPVSAARQLHEPLRRSPHPMEFCTSRLSIHCVFKTMISTIRLEEHASTQQNILYTISFPLPYGLCKHQRNIRHSATLQPHPSTLLPGQDMAHHRNDCAGPQSASIASQTEPWRPGYQAFWPRGYELGQQLCVISVFLLHLSRSRLVVLLKILSCRICEKVIPAQCIGYLHEY